MRIRMFGHYWQLGLVLLWVLESTVIFGCCVLALRWFGGSDAGAHVSQLCDAPQATDLLGNWVRVRKAITLEMATTSRGDTPRTPANTLANM